MPEPTDPADDRRAEAERLIRRARGLLTAREDEMVVTYLDAAIDTLHMPTDTSLPQSA